MENDTRSEKERLLSVCKEDSWKFFVNRLSALKGFNGMRFRSEILGRITRPINFDHALNKVVKQKQNEHTDLSLEDARVAIMTENGIIFGILKSSGHEELPKPFIRTMKALNANLPWNKTGFNEITVTQLNVNDLEEASNFMKSHAIK